MQYSIKYRPQVFSQVVSQGVPVRILQNSFAMGRVPNAVLITGTHGCGKTTLARLFAKLLNCEKPIENEPCNNCQSCLEKHNLSIYEFDSASNNSVDDIRELESLCQQVHVGKYLTIILDECHQLSKSAQSALLKLLEEPPERTIFMLLTTEPEKLEETIRSRCLSLQLRQPTSESLFTNLQQICSIEGISCEEGVLRRISEINSVRDAQQILNQLAILSDGNITEETLDSSGQLISLELYKELADVFSQRDTRYGLTMVQDWLNRGIDLAHLFDDGLVIVFHDLLRWVSGCGEIGYMTGISQESFDRNCEKVDYPFVSNCLREWEMTVVEMRQSKFPKVIWGVYLAKVFG
jgi:DNA polymerase-3 subunit gamma/tau